MVATVGTANAQQSGKGKAAGASGDAEESARRGNAAAGAPLADGTGLVGAAMEADGHDEVHASSGPVEDDVGDGYAKFSTKASEYLEQTVLEVLQDGLECLCRERPANPVDYLALFLLRRAPGASSTAEVPLTATVPVPTEYDEE